jgi:pilus assembly protein Flp/PilA
MKHIVTRFQNRKNKRGQTLVEYALILAFISVVAIGVLYALGFNISSIFTTLTSQMATTTGSH